MRAQMRHWIAALSLAASACGPSSGAPQLSFADAWIRESPDRSSAAYVTIANGGSGADRLTEVAVAGGGKASIHESRTSNGIARMSPLPNGLEIPAKADTELRPGAAHLMLMGLASPPRSGDRLTLFMTFERSGEKAVEFEVRPALTQG